MTRKQAFLEIVVDVLYAARDGGVIMLCLSLLFIGMIVAGVK